VRLATWNKRNADDARRDRGAILLGGALKGRKAPSR
jgi:hypothetical protein